MFLDFEVRNSNPSFWPVEHFFVSKIFLSVAFNSFILQNFEITGPSMKFDKIHSKEGMSRGLICIRFDNLTKFEHFWICQISKTANKNDPRVFPEFWEFSKMCHLLFIHFLVSHCFVAKFCVDTYYEKICNSKMLEPKGKNHINFDIKFWSCIQLLLQIQHDNDKLFRYRYFCNLHWCNSLLVHKDQAVRNQIRHLPNRWCNSIRNHQDDWHNQPSRDSCCPLF